MKEAYEKWCKETRRNGSIIYRSSLYEFFEWYEIYSLGIPIGKITMLPVPKEEIEGLQIPVYKKVID